MMDMVNIKKWLTVNKEVVNESDFMLIVCDTFDDECQPVFCKKNELKQTFQENDKSIHRVEAIYDLTLLRDMSIHEDDDEPLLIGKIEPIDIVKSIDESAVDSFAIAMKEKLTRARDKGRDGWYEESVINNKKIIELFYHHLSKDNDGNIVDLANFLMFMHQRGVSAKELKENQGSCTWNPTVEFYHEKAVQIHWVSSCGYEVDMSDAPKDNGMNYCPCCGKKVVESLEVVKLKKPEKAGLVF